MHSSKHNYLSCVYLATSSLMLSIYSYTQLRREITLRRSHMREKMLDNLENIFSDLPFPAGVRSPTTSGNVIKCLQTDHEFIYAVTDEGDLVRKFHSEYIINTISLLFTGCNARLQFAMRDHEHLTVPLLAAVCTLVCICDILALVLSDLPGI